MIDLEQIKARDYMANPGINEAWAARRDVLTLVAEVERLRAELLEAQTSWMTHVETASRANQKWMHKCVELEAQLRLLRPPTGGE